MLSSPELLRHFHPLLRARALREKPQRVVIGGDGFVLFRDENGRARALVDRCPHRFAPLSLGRVRGGRLACHYHGWSFDGDGEGHCPSQPTLRCRATALQVVEEHGWLWLAGNDVPAARLPAVAAPGYRLAGSLALDADAPLHVVLDNFNEDEHTPFIHDRLGWAADDASRIEFSSVVRDDCIEVAYTAPQRPSRLLPLVAIRGGDTFHNSWVVRFSPVHIVYTLKWTDPRTQTARPLTLRYAFFFVPLGEARTRIVAFMLTRGEGRLQRLLPALDPVIWALSWKEVFDDARWLRHIANTPYSFRGMRLNRFDGPLSRSRHLLENIYYGIASAQARSASESP
jgi:phenylpropionate dioxygenase-like ring-hydroxylating dioxygenase large terminal subunit